MALLALILWYLRGIARVFPVLMAPNRVVACARPIQGLTPGGAMHQTALAMRILIKACEGVRERGGVVFPCISIGRSALVCPLPSEGREVHW